MSYEQIGQSYRVACVKLKRYWINAEIRSPAKKHTLSSIQQYAFRSTSEKGACHLQSRRLDSKPKLDSFQISIFVICPTNRLLLIMCSRQVVLLMVALLFEGEMPIKEAAIGKELVVCFILPASLNHLLFSSLARQILPCFSSTRCGRRSASIFVINLILLVTGMQGIWG